MIVTIIYHDNSIRILNYTKPENESFRKACQKNPNHLLLAIEAFGPYKTKKIN